jgi:hypothetical protein
MISVNCPRCTKGLIFPNREAGLLRTCPSCGEGLVVPAPAGGRSRARRRWALLAAFAFAVAVVGWGGYLVLRPRLLRERATSALYALSPRWRGVTWQQWEPARGAYRLTVWYNGDHMVRYFEVTGQADDQQVQVRPDEDSRRRLAFGTFHRGVRPLFECYGVEAAEEPELEELATDLCGTLQRVLR